MEFIKIILPQQRPFVHPTNSQYGMVCGQKLSGGFRAGHFIASNKWPGHIFMSMCGPNWFNLLRFVISERLIEMSISGRVSRECLVVRIIAWLECHCVFSYQDHKIEEGQIIGSEFSSEPSSASITFCNNKQVELIANDVAVIRFKCFLIWFLELHGV